MTPFNWIVFGVDHEGAVGIARLRMAPGGI